MDKQTYLQPERFAYPNGGQTRKGLAYFSDGKLRRVWAGIPDTFFSVPAHARINEKYVRGFLTVGETNDLLDTYDAKLDGEWVFNVYKGK